jgi:eukaryotic-like serine/threonine-protein kinase
VPSSAQPSSEPAGSGRVPARGPSPIDNPRVLAGRYRLDSVIGKGSMGTVWAATDQILHRQVAIKEIDFPPGTPAVERAQLEHRTLREARAIAALSNPYVITLFDILTLDNGPVIVMELLHARSLAEILRKVGRLPDGQAATIGVAVASGLLAAHAAGITHRDVKPGNVLICDDGRIKLTDFGIARSTAEQTMTATGLLLGSPAYIAPEVASGVPAGPISDAWSLGGLLFATVEGHPPFDQGTAISTLTSVVKDPVPPHPHSGRLGAVVSGLLVKTPRLRMRIDRALAIMRGIADDPSGTNLAAVARIPRDDLPRPPFPPNGASPTGASPAAWSQLSVQPPHAASGNPPAALHSTARPATSPADASTHPPAWQPHGPPSAPWSGSRQDPPPLGRPGPQSSLGPQQPAQFSRPIVADPAGEALPPPPWASTDSASLAPLPVAVAEPAHRGRILTAILVAVLAAIAGFFGVRIIADLATDNAAPAVAAVVPASGFTDRIL